MNPIIAFIKASRWLNLLIIVYTQLAVKFFVLDPIIKAPRETELAGIISLTPAIGNLEIALLVISTVLIAAAGNLINDYFDLKIDRVNKPEKIIVGRHIKRRVAMMAHLVLTGLGLALSLYLSIKVGAWQLFFIHVFWAITLWYYSTELKYLFFWGNLAIALCIALVPLSVGMYEIVALVKEYKVQWEAHMEIRRIIKGLNINLIAYTLSFSGFALLVTLAREITKDIIDIEGDKAFHCRTIPIQIGIRKSKYLINIITLLVIIGLIYIQQFYFPDLQSTLFLGGLVLLGIGSIILTSRASEKKDFKRASTLNKLLTVLGVSFSIIIYLKLSW